MKKTNWIILASLAIVASGVTLYLALKPQSTAVTFSGPERITRDPNSLPEGVPEPDRFKSDEDIKAFIAKEGAIVGAAKLMAAGRNKPIEFYAKVLDQYEQPIEGAEITLQIAQDAPLTGWNNVDATTHADANGAFTISGIRGEILEIQHIRKASYVFNNSVKQNFWSWQYTPEVLVNTTTADKPWIFRGWKIGEVAEELISGNSQSFVEPNNSYYIKFDGSKGRDYPEKNTDGNIKVTIHRKRDDTQLNPVSWSIRMEITNGGLIETDDKYMYEAPISGYEPIFTISSKRSSENWAPEFHQNFYIKEKSNYGKIKVKINPFHNERSSMRIYYEINPEGSQSLLFKNAP